MKNVQTFDQFVNEGINVKNAESNTIEAARKADGSDAAESYTEMDAKIEKSLKAKSKDIIIVDEYFDDESKDGKSFYEACADETKKGGKDIDDNGFGGYTSFYPKAKICKYEESGYTGYFMTKKTFNHYLDTWYGGTLK